MVAQRVESEVHVSLSKLVKVEVAPVIVSRDLWRVDLHVLEVQRLLNFFFLK